MNIINKHIYEHAYGIEIMCKDIIFCFQRYSTDIEWILSNEYVCVRGFVREILIKNISTVVTSFFSIVIDYTFTTSDQ